MPRAAQALPAALTQAAEVFARWRQRRAQRKIPDRFWKRAVALAKNHGVHRTAHVLRLEYAGLKRRVEAAGGVAAEASAPAFVEVRPLAGGVECVVEVEHPNGAKLRIHVKGAGVPDLAGLSRSLMGAPR
jgi:hypothetical protein